MDFTLATQRYLRALESEGRSEKTRKNHHQALGQFGQWLERQALEWTTLTTDDFQRYITAFAETHSIATTRNHRIFLTKFYLRAAHCKWIEQSPVPQQKLGRYAKLSEPHRLRLAHTESAGNIAQAITEFGESLLIRGCSALTEENYRYLLAQWARWLVQKQRQWTAVEPRDLMVFLNAYRIGHSRTSVALFGTCLRSFYRWAERSGYVAISPAKDLETGKRDRPLPRDLTPRVLRTLLEQLNHPGQDLNDDQRAEWRRNRLIVLFLLLTGCRLDECARADWAMINVDTRQIRIYGKGGKERTIPIHPQLLQELLDYGRGATHGPLFLSQRGDRLQAEGISEMFRRFIHGRLGVKCTAHQLRHTFASQLRRNGVDLRAIQRLLGHESLRTTQIYTHVYDEELQLAIEKLPANWWELQPMAAERAEEIRPPSVAAQPERAGMDWEAFTALSGLKDA
jgi:integrase/recombinase XerD